jgi:hypothetical protein
MLEALPSPWRDIAGLATLAVVVRCEFMILLDDLKLTQLSSGARSAGLCAPAAVGDPPDVLLGGV